VYESDMLTAYYWISSASLHPPTSVTRSAGFANVFAGWSWGSTALHPGFMLSPRSAGFANLFAWRFLGFRCAPPQALRCHPLRGFKK